MRERCVSWVVLVTAITFVLPTARYGPIGSQVGTQQAITRDNVAIRIDGVLYVRVVDAMRASYGVDRPLYAVMQLAQTSMRAELGKRSLDNTFEERDALNEQIVRVCAHSPPARVEDVAERRRAHTVLAVVAHQAPLSSAGDQFCI